MRKKAKPMQPKLRLRDRRRRMMWVKVAVGTAVVLVSLVAIFYVARLSSLTIAKVEVKGAELVEASSVKKMVEERLVGSYAYLIPRANAFFAPRGEIVRVLKDTFPQVATVTLSQRELETLTVTIGERQPAGKWCQTAEEGGYCFLMDADGFIYTRGDTPTDFIRYSGVLSGDPIGQTYLPGEFQKLNTFAKETAETINRTADSVVIEENNDASLSFKEGGILRFVRTNDPRVTLDNVASVFGSQSFKNKREFEYADFRYGNKVYVKFVGE